MNAKYLFHHSTQSVQITLDPYDGAQPERANEHFRDCRRWSHLANWTTGRTRPTARATTAASARAQALSAAAAALDAAR